VLGAEAGQWTFRDGAFYAGKSASIARDIKLPDTADLQFDLAWSGTLVLSVALYTDSLQPMVITNKDKGADFGAFYSMRFLSLSVEMMRIKKNEPVANLAPVIVPAFSQTNRVHIDVRACKQSNTLALAVDGRLLQVWNDTNGFVGEGAGVRFVQNGIGSGPVKISNLHLAPWDGVLETNQTNMPPSDRDVVWLTNNTWLAGVIESLADGKLTLLIQPDKIEVPLARVTRLAFAAQAGPAKELAGSVRALFAQGGPLTFQLESWTAEGVNLRSPVFGRARFDTNAFRRLVFPPLNAAAGNGTNGAPGSP
jgi:hypothetical protein